MLRPRFAFAAILLRCNDKLQHLLPRQSQRGFPEQNYNPYTATCSWNTPRHDKTYQEINPWTFSSFSGPQLDIVRQALGFHLTGFSHGLSSSRLINHQTSGYKWGWPTLVFQVLSESTFTKVTLALKFNSPAVSSGFITLCLMVASLPWDICFCFIKRAGILICR